MPVDPNLGEYLNCAEKNKTLVGRTFSKEYLLLCETLNIAPENEVELKTGDIFKRLAIRYNLSSTCNINAFTSYAQNANMTKVPYQRLFLEQKAVESLCPELFGKNGQYPCEDEDVATIELFFKEFGLLAGS